MPRLPPADRGLGRPGVALRQSQQGQAGLRLEAIGARFPVRFPGRVEITEQSVDLPSLVARLTRRRRALAAEAALSSPPRLRQRVLPRAIQPQHLSAMHQAAAGERDQVGLAAAPRGQGRRPFPGATNSLRVAACQDGAAIDDPGSDRRQLACRHRDHRLVEEGKPFLNAPQPNQDVALFVPSQGEQVGVAEPLAGRRSLTCSSRGRFQVARPLPLKDKRQQQVARPPPDRRPRARATVAPGPASRGPPISPRCARLMPTQKAQRSAASCEPASRCALYARCRQPR